MRRTAGAGRDGHPGRGGWRGVKFGAVTIRKVWDE